VAVAIIVIYQFLLIISMFSKAIKNKFLLYSPKEINISYANLLLEMKIFFSLTRTRIIFKFIILLNEFGIFLNIFE
jgi:hypothetical protein